jgi:hypothetical protein
VHEKLGGRRRRSRSARRTRRDHVHVQSSVTSNWHRYVTGPPRSGTTGTRSSSPPAPCC